MLRLRISAQVEQFRSSLQEWLKKSPPPVTSSDTSLESFIEVGRRWQGMLAKQQWVGVHWPKEYGGRGLTLAEEAVVQEELVRVNSPQLLGLFGLSMVGPVLIHYGTEDQKKRHLAKILSAEEIWCQGFSEPGAGSDLAAVRTKAIPHQDGFIVQGQKIWTSFAQIAEWCFLLVRTEDNKEKHRGLTYLLVDMKSPGITARPLKQISGDDEFNEVFFDNVFVPSSNVLGKVGEGWKIAISTLMHERVVLTFARQLQSEVALRQLVAKVTDDTPEHLKRELARQIAQTCAVRALSYEHLLAYASGETPGPEGSLDKLFWSESFQQIAKLSLEFEGRKAILGEQDPAIGSDVHRYLYSRGRSIAAGSSEIQKNIIAERLLSLPRLKYSV